VTNAEQMAELAGWTAVDPKEEAFASPQERRVRDALSTRSPRTIEEIAKVAGLMPKEVAGVIGMLDLAGVLEEREHGWVLTADGR